VGLRQRGHTGSVDFGPKMESIRGFPAALYIVTELWELDQWITRRQANKISQILKNQVNQQHENNKSTTTSPVVVSSAV